MTPDPTQLVIAGIRQGTRAAHVLFDHPPLQVAPRQIGGVQIQYCPEPLEDVWLEQPIQQVWGWPTAQEDLARHVGHVLLSCPDAGETPVLEQMFQLAQVAGRVLEWPGAMAYLWVEGAALLRPEVVQSMLADLEREDGAFPLDLWMGVRYFQAEEGEGFLLDTLGLQAFDRRDLEVRVEDPERSGRDVGFFQEILRRAALYTVLRSDEMVMERHELEFPDGSTYRLQDGMSRIFPSRKVWQLDEVVATGDQPLETA